MNRGTGRYRGNDASLGRDAELRLEPLVLSSRLYLGVPALEELPMHSPAFRLSDGHDKICRRPAFIDLDVEFVSCSHVIILRRKHKLTWNCVRFRPNVLAGLVCPSAD